MSDDGMTYEEMFHHTQAALASLEVKYYALKREVEKLREELDDARVAELRLRGRLRKTPR